MSRKNSKSYKYGMRVLYAIMAVSFIFFAGIVTLRANHDAQRYVIKNFSDEIFQIDVLKYHTMALTQDIHGKHEIAHSLLKKGFFSPIYINAGARMTKSLADEGHAPSQALYGDVLTYSTDKNERIVKSRYYYTLAAHQGYEPAIVKLSTLD